MKNLEIARILNVSPATVSLALNDKPGVSPVTKKRILDLKNASLRKEEADTLESLGGNDIGVLVYKEKADVIAETVFFTELLQGIDGYLKGRGYRSQIVMIHADSIDSYIDELNELTFKGLIIIATEMSDEIAVKFRDNLQMPFVMVDAYYAAPGIDSVVMDNFGGIYQGYHYLKELGFSKIGFVGSANGCRNFTDRLITFKNCVLEDENNQCFDYIYIVRADPEEAERDFNKLLDNGLEMPDAFLTANDRIAVGVMSSLSKHGFKVPDDISIIGFDDMPMVQYVSPPLTSVRVYPQEIAWLSVRSILRNIEHPEDLPHAIKYNVGTRLVERESVKKKG